MDLSYKHKGTDIVSFIETKALNIPVASASLGIEFVLFL
jgi:hypothetical protein